MGQLKAGMSSFAIGLQWLADRAPMETPWQALVKVRMDNLGEPGGIFFRAESSSSSVIFLPPLSSIWYAIIMALKALSIDTDPLENIVRFGKVGDTCTETSVGQGTVKKKIMMERCLDSIYVLFQLWTRLWKASNPQEKVRRMVY